MAIEKVGVYRKWLEPVPRKKKQAYSKIGMARKTTALLDCEMVPALCLTFSKSFCCAKMPWMALFSRHIRHLREIERFVPDSSGLLSVVNR